MLYPYKMIPVYKDYIWGGYNLKRLGKCMPENRVAESWELSGMPGSESRIANGYLKGQSLIDVIKKYGKLILGEHFSPYAADLGMPVLLKLIDANDRLSIQVHPHNEYAKEHENGKSGKTEAWYIIDAGPEATVIHGFSENKDKNEIYNSILNNSHENLYRKVAVKKGDMVFVPAGTVHALNNGLVIAEIQQHSDLTYRLFDYDRTDASGRKRQLHTEKAFNVLDFKNRRPLYSGLSVWDGDIETKYLAISPYFCIKKLESRGTAFEFTADGSFSAFMFISGEAEIASTIEKVTAKSFETVFIPAYMGKYKIEGVFEALQIFVPDSAAITYNFLLEQGFSNEEIIANIAGAEELNAVLKTAV